MKCGEVDVKVASSLSNPTSFGSGPEEVQTDPSPIELCYRLPLARADGGTETGNKDT